MLAGLFDGLLKRGNWRRAHCLFALRRSSCASARTDAGSLWATRTLKRAARCYRAPACGGCLKCWRSCRDSDHGANTVRLQAARALHCFEHTGRSVRLRKHRLNRAGFPEAISFESRRHSWLVQPGVVALLGLGRRDVTYRLQQPAIVEPVDPGKRGKLDCLEGAARVRGDGSAPPCRGR
jgi:hypothetical protein